MAERILAEAKNALVKKGFDEKGIIELHQRQKVGTAHDICHRANREKTDEMINDLREIGAVNAALTGSGSAVFGIFKEIPENSLKDKHPFSETTNSEVKE